MPEEGLWNNRPVRNRGCYETVDCFFVAGSFRPPEYWNSKEFRYKKTVWIAKGVPVPPLVKVILSTAPTTTFSKVKD
jgi:hypothetical protein